LPFMIVINLFAIVYKMISPTARAHDLAPSLKRSFVIDLLEKVLRLVCCSAISAFISATVMVLLFYSGLLTEYNLVFLSATGIFLILGSTGFLMFQNPHTLSHNHILMRIRSMMKRKMVDRDRIEHTSTIEDSFVLIHNDKSDGL